MGPQQNKSYWLGSPKLLWGRLLFPHFFLLLFFQIGYMDLKKIRLVQEEKVYQITEK